MWMQEKLDALDFFRTDASLKAAGGICNGIYFHKQFPEWVWELDHNVHIAHLEMLAILIGLRVWSDQLKGIRFIIACDNEVVVRIINSGRSHNALLQCILREVVYELATLDSQMHARHIFSQENDVADYLSRMDTDDRYLEKFEQIKQRDWHERIVQDDLLKLHSFW